MVLVSLRLLTSKNFKNLFVGVGKTTPFFMEKFINNTERCLLAQRNRMATQIIKVEFDLPLPDEYMVDHNRAQLKSRKYTYHGPDKIYLQIGADGYEKYGPLTEDDKAMVVLFLQIAQNFSKLTAQSIL